MYNDVTLPQLAAPVLQASPEQRFTEQHLTSHCYHFAAVEFTSCSSWLLMLLLLWQLSALPQICRTGWPTRLASAPAAKRCSGRLFDTAVSDGAGPRLLLAV